MSLEAITRALDTAAVSYALIGAHAMAARGYARFTLDVDLLTTDTHVLDAGMWTALEARGTSVDRRRGDHDDPLAGVVRIHSHDGALVDVVVGRWEWERQLVARAEPMVVMGITVAVPPIGDLILLKLAAGGHLDLHDAAVLLAIADRARTIRDVEAHLSEVRPDVRALWASLIAPPAR